MAMPALLDDSAKYVTLSVDGEMFAVDVNNVIEILDMRPANRIPQAPPFMLGVIQARGRAVAVIDLRTKLGLPMMEPTVHTRILMLEIGGEGSSRAVGLVADRVYEVTELDAGETGPAPDVGVRWRSEYIKGIGRRGDRFVIVFDLERLFTSEETALIGGVG